MLAVRIRHTSLNDGAAIWQLIRDSGGLDLNSPYAYLLFSHYFADACIVAEAEDGLAGTVVGFKLPADPETIFVWQVAVSPAHRGKRLASHLLAAFVGGHVRDGGVRYLEATVTPSNEASQRTFRGLARDFDADCREGLLFPASVFPPDEDHEDEHQFRIGPFSAEAQRRLGESAPPLTLEA